MKTSKSTSRAGTPSRPPATTQRNSSTISLKEQLSEANLQNARHLALLSKIHHLALTHAGGSLALDTIKRLIDRSSLLDFDSSSSQESEASQVSQVSQTSQVSQASQVSQQSRASSQQDRALTPPVTDSEAHSKAHSHLDLATTSDADLTYRKRGVSGNVSSSAFQVLLTDANTSQNIHADVGNNLNLNLNLNNLNLNHNHHQLTTAPKPSSSSIKTKQANTPLLDIFEMSSTETHTTAAPAIIQPLAASTMPTVKSHLEADKDEDQDEDDFTLEEELEGIADAPVEKRAAMRKALREKQTVQNRQMREAAADKRRNAEKEAYLLKQTLLRDGHHATMSSNSAYSQPQPQPQPRPQPQQPVVRATTAKPKLQGDFTSGNVARGNVETTGKKSPAAAAAKTTVQSIDTDVKFPRNAPFVPVGVEDSDDENTSRSSVIIDFETEAPKNSSRFGIAFDASKLDEATTDRISGIKGVKDSRRSVLVQNIGPETAVPELLSYIRGGSVLDVKLTEDPSDGGKTRNAMVTFKTSKEAHACLALGSSVGFQSALVHKWRFTLLPTASYPTNDVIPSCAPGYVSDSLAEEPTRCLAVENFPKSLINELCTELYLNKLQAHNKVHVVEEMWFAKDTLHIHFTSIQEAKKAHGIVSILHYGRYRAGVHYLPDPCAQAEAGLSSDGIAKTASDGHQGLKSLLETTGLVSYAKLYVNKMKSSVAASAPRSAPRSVTMSILSAAPAGAPVCQQDIRPVVPQKQRPASSLSSTHSTTSQTHVSKPAMTGFPNSTASLLMSLDAGMCGAAAQTKVDNQLGNAPSIDTAKPVAASESSPWTDTLMSGLDMF